MPPLDSSQIDGLRKLVEDTAMESAAHQRQLDTAANLKAQGVTDEQIIFVAPTLTAAEVAAIPGV